MKLTCANFETSPLRVSGPSGPSGIVLRGERGRDGGGDGADRSVPGPSVVAVHAGPPPPRPQPLPLRPIPMPPQSDQVSLQLKSKDSGRAAEWNGLRKVQMIFVVVRYRSDGSDGAQTETPRSPSALRPADCPQRNACKVHSISHRCKAKSYH